MEGIRNGVRLLLVRRRAAPVKGFACVYAPVLNHSMEVNRASDQLNNMKIATPILAQ